VGLIVDSVAEVVSIPEENIVPPPEANTVLTTAISRNRKGRREVKLLLDCNKLLNDEDCENLLIYKK